MNVQLLLCHMVGWLRGYAHLKRMPHATSTEVPRFHLVRFSEGFSVLLPRSPIVARTVVSNSLACGGNQCKRKSHDDDKDGFENKLVVCAELCSTLQHRATYTTDLLCFQFATRHPTGIHNWSVTWRSPRIESVAVLF
jgi:hypothetical protein